MTDIQVGDKIRATDTYGTEVIGTVSRMYSYAGDDYIRLTGEYIGLNRKVWVIEVLESAKPSVGTFITGTMTCGTPFKGLVIGNDYVSTVQEDDSGVPRVDEYTYWDDIKEFEVVG